MGLLGNRIPPSDRQKLIRRIVTASLLIALLVPTACAAPAPDNAGSGPIVSYDPGRDGSSPFAPDGVLDCPTDVTWVEQGSVLEGTVGSPTPDAALEEALGAFLRNGSGEVKMLDQGLGSLVVDGREVVAAIVTEAPAGGWLVLTLTGCGGFEG